MLDAENVPAQPDLTAWSDDDLKDLHGYIRFAENVAISIGGIFIFGAGVLFGYAIGVGL